MTKLQIEGVFEPNMSQRQTCVGGHMWLQVTCNYFHFLKLLLVLTCVYFIVVNKI